MKNLNFRIWGPITALCMVFFGIGCVGDPIKVDLPQNHPANPQAKEAAFIPPPNPFQSHMQMTGHESGGPPPMTQKEQVPSHQQQMTHEMDQMGKDSMSAPESDMKKEDHQH